MKKNLTFFAFLAICTLASAQMRTVVIYIPGVGEHQFGLSVAPTYSNQQFSMTAKNTDSYEENYKTDGVLTNNIGVNAGIFYGYETVHGNTFEQGNHTSILYCVNPFSGDISINHKGKNEQYKIDYLSQRVSLHSTSFLTYRISEQFTVSGGIGLGIGFTLSSDVKVDGQPQEKIQSDDPFGDSFFFSTMQFDFDLSVGFKYWLTDEWFFGTRLQYTFYTLNMEKVMNKMTDENKGNKWDYNGNITFDPDNNKASCKYYYPRVPFQLVCSIGYTW